MSNGGSTVEELKPALEHARALFIYHAQQRFTSINYFFVAYALSATAYVGLLEKAVSPYFRLILGLYAAVVTAVFFGLDRRNAQLVRIDEQAMEELEGRVKNQLTLSKDFQMAHRWHEEATKLQFQNILPVMFLVLVCLAIMAMAHALYDLCNSS